MLLAGATASAEPFDRRFMIAAAASVVRIEAGQGGPRYAVGTGTVTGPQEVVTANHVVRGASRIYVISGGLRHLATVRRVDALHDICVLAVDNLAARPLAARPSGQLQVGEPVAAIGYSGGGGLNFTTGAVAQLHRFSGSMVVEATAPFTSGASGGPLLDSEGRLVGLLMFRAMNGTGHFFCCSCRVAGRCPVGGPPGHAALLAGSGPAPAVLHAGQRAARRFALGRVGDLASRMEPQ
jgi:S1-C subfamily serine protease